MNQTSTSDTRDTAADGVRRSTARQPIDRAITATFNGNIVPLRQHHRVRDRDTVPTRLEATNTAPRLLRRVLHDHLPAIRVALR